MNHEKYGNIDPECIILCDAINKIPGLSTTYSCCGHGKQGFLIFIDCQKLDNFAPLVYILDKSKAWLSSMGKWTIELATRTPDSGVAYLLYSEHVGEVAYQEANVIARIIDGYLLPPRQDIEFDYQWNTMHQRLAEMMEEREKGGDGVV